MSAFIIFGAGFLAGLFVGLVLFGLLTANRDMEDM